MESRAPFVIHVIKLASSVDKRTSYCRRFFPAIVRRFLGSSTYAFPLAINIIGVFPSLSLSSQSGLYLAKY